MKYRIARCIQLILLFSLLFSCRKHAEEPSNPLPEIRGEKRPIGTTIGTAVTKNIGAAGGTIALPDSSVTIVIPAGALTSSTEISIQPITNTNLAGIGHAFRLLPHGTIFQKPVSITMSYAAVADSCNLPQTLGLAYQDSTGVWQFTGGNDIDSTLRIVTYKSTHFSDWSLMPWLILKPARATLGQGQEITLEALHYIPFKQCNCDDDLVVPIPEGNPYPVGEPTPLEQKYIGQWQLVGPGTLLPTTANQAVYKAPASITTNNSATVALQLKSAHILILVSSIRLPSDNWFEMRFNGGAWKSYDASAFLLDTGRGGISFAQNTERLSMVFPSSTGTHEWDEVYGNNTTGFNYWPDGTSTVYVATYTYNYGLFDSGGSVQIMEFGAVGQFVSGTFTIDPAGYNSTSDGHQISTSKIEGRFKLRRTR